MITNSDSKHYEFFVTKAKADGPLSPPAATPVGSPEWVLLHVTSADATTLLAVWSRQKKR